MFSGEGPRSEETRVALAAGDRELDIVGDWQGDAVGVPVSKLLNTSINPQKNRSRLSAPQMPTFWGSVASPRVRKPGSKTLASLPSRVSRAASAFWAGGDGGGKIADALTGVTRNVDQVATDRAKSKAKDPASVKDVLEGWNKYITRVMAGLDEAAQKEVHALAASIADGLTIDPSPSRRETGPGKAFVEKANSLLASPSTLEEKVTKLLGKCPDFDLERDETGAPEVTSLARLVKAFTEALQAESGI